MADIKITRTQHKASILSKSAKGAGWMLQNMYTNTRENPPISVEATVDADVLSDTVNALKEAGLEVEE